MMQFNTQKDIKENQGLNLLKMKRQRANLIFEIIKIKNKRKWSKEEDYLLIKLAEKYREKHWKEISSNFLNKNALQCFSRYKRIRPGIVKGSWSKEEDEKILKLVEVYGKSWSKISKILSTRNGKQIRDRFINVLDPEIKKGKFTDEEDRALVRFYKYYGPRWATISKYFPYRTADMIKNRFHSSIKKLFFGNHSHAARTSLLRDNNFLFTDEINDRTMSENSNSNLEFLDQQSPIIKTPSLVKESTNQITDPILTCPLQSPKEDTFKLSKMSFDIKDEITNENEPELTPKAQPYYLDYIDSNDLYDFKEFLDENPALNGHFYEQGDLLTSSDKYLLSYEVNSPDAFKFEDYFTV